MATWRDDYAGCLVVLCLLAACAAPSFDAAWETLNARFAGEKPWRAPVGEMRVRLQRELDERWLPFVQREFKRVEEAQALIDTPAEYERVANACDGEIKKRTR